MPQNDSTLIYAVAFAGMEPDNSINFDNYLTKVSEETTKQIPFGRVVMQGTGDQGCKQFTSQTGKPLGIVPYSAVYQVNKELASIADSDGNIGLIGGTDIAIKHRGRLWVKIDENVTPTSAVRARTTVVATFGPGTFRASASAGVTNDFSKFCQWCGTYLAADGFGLLEFDFLAAKALMVAD